MNRGGKHSFAVLGALLFVGSGRTGGLQGGGGGGEAAAAGRDSGGRWQARLPPREVVAACESPRRLGQQF